MSTAQQKRSRVKELYEELSQIWRRYPPDSADLPPAVAVEVRDKLRQLESLQAELESDDLKGRWNNMERWLNEPTDRPPQPGDGGGGHKPVKSIGEAFVSSAAFKNYDPGVRRGPSADLELKTLLDTTGWVPESPRTGRIELAVSPALNVIDLIARGATQYNAIAYMLETTATSGAAEVAEGAQKGESTLVVEEQTSPVRTIATVLPITNDLLQDVSACRSYIESRLAYFVRQRLDSQILNGDGVAPNLEGILNVSGIQTQAKGSDPTPDAISKAITKCIVNGGYVPDGVILHPNDWQEIRHLRTADGIYLWGSPSERGEARIWGLPVAQSTAISEGTGLVGSFQRAAMLFYRTDMQVAISDSHSDFFIKNKVMVRCEVRVAFVVFRPEAFCQVTGI